MSFLRNVFAPMKHRLRHHQPTRRVVASARRHARYRRRCATLLHIWPYKDLNARHEIRANATEAKVWPPKDGHAQLETMSSHIYLPAPFSPMP